jgi:hypothetical protein
MRNRQGRGADGVCQRRPKMDPFRRLKIDSFGFLFLGATATKRVKMRPSQCWGSPPSELLTGSCFRLGCGRGRAALHMRAALLVPIEVWSDRYRDNHLRPKARDGFTGSGQLGTTPILSGFRYGSTPAGVTGSFVETRSVLCTYCLFALETSVGHRRRSDSPPHTVLGYRFQTSKHPALGPAQ